MTISRSVILRIRNVSGKRCTGNKNARFYVQYFFFFQNSCLLWNNVQNIVQPDRPLMTIWRTRATNTLQLRNNYCFSTITMVARTRLYVTLHVHCLSCSVFWNLYLNKFYISIFYIMSVNSLFWEGVRRLHQTLKEIHGTRKFNKPRLSCFIPGKEPRYQLKRRLFGTQSWPGSFGQKKNTLLLPWFETRNLPVHGLLTTPTKLSQMHLHKEDFKVFVSSDNTIWCVNHIWC
jgi:hypothetical protein